jgi:CRP-like cAMP-binding protein
MTMTASDLARFELLGDLAPDELDRLASAASVADLGDGDALFTTGEAADSVFGLVSGQVVLRAAVEGRSTIVMTAGAGELLGWTALREGATWLTTGRSVGRSRVVILPVEAVLALLESPSPTTRRLVRRLFGLAARHLEETQAQLLRRGHEGPITAG